MDPKPPYEPRPPYEPNLEYGEVPYEEYGDIVLDMAVVGDVKEEGRSGTLGIEDAGDAGEEVDGRGG